MNEEFKRELVERYKSHGRTMFLIGLFGGLLIGVLVGLSL